MPKGEIVKFKFGSREFGIVSMHRADERLQSELPELALPPMNEAARAAFMAVLEYEKPPANDRWPTFSLWLRRAAFPLIPPTGFPISSCRASIYGSISRG